MQFKSITWLPSRLHTVRTIGSDISDHRANAASQAPSAQPAAHAEGEKQRPQMFVIYSNKDFQKFPSSPLLQFTASLPPSLPLFFLSPSPNKDSVLPRTDKHNVLQVTKSAAATGSQRQIKFQDSPPFLFGFFFLFFCSSPVLRWVWPCEAASVCTAPFQFLRVCTHTSPFLPLSLSLSLALSHTPSPSRNRGRRRMRVGGGSVGTQKALCLGSFHMVSFKLAYWTHYAIIYFHIQRRDVEGTRGPHSVLLPPLPFLLSFLDPFFFPPCTHRGRQIQIKSENYLSEKSTAEFVNAVAGCFWKIRLEHRKRFPLWTPLIKHKDPTEFIFVLLYVTYGLLRGRSSSDYDHLISSNIDLSRDPTCAIKCQ